MRLSPLESQDPYGDIPPGSSQNLESEEVGGKILMGQGLSHGYFDFKELMLLIIRRRGGFEVKIISGEAPTARLR